MIFKIKYKTQAEAISYYDWITGTGVSCMWDYDNQKHMIIEFNRAEDATAFRLKFGV
jgi:hypothetical protein